MNEVHETAAGHLMLAGDFRFMWHQLSTVHGVKDGLSGIYSIRSDEGTGNEDIWYLEIIPYAKKKRNSTENTLAKK